MSQHRVEVVKLYERERTMLVAVYFKTIVADIAGRLYRENVAGHGFESKTVRDTSIHSST
jgi:hypothetical protein